MKPSIIVYVAIAIWCFGLGFFLVQIVVRIKRALNRALVTLGER